MSIFASLESLVEIYIAYIFYKQSLVKIRKIQLFDPNDTDNKTYCLMSLWIVKVIRSKYFFFALLKLFKFGQTVSMNTFKDWFYTDVPDDHVNVLVNKAHLGLIGYYCKETLAAKIVNVISDITQNALNFLD